MSSEFIYDKITEDGTDIHFWYQGTGAPLVFIPGGGGLGGMYNRILPVAAKKYTAITYDRRGCGRSKGSEQHPLNLGEQCRDITKILQKLGYNNANIFGSSGGAVIAFTFGTLYPQYCTHIFAHEAPTGTLEPDAVDWYDFCFDVYKQYTEKGYEAASQAFMKLMVGMGENAPPPPPSVFDFEAFYKYEYLMISLSTPDLEKLRRQGIPVTVAAGEDSKNAWYARTTFTQQERLGCKRVLVPSHHMGYLAKPEEFFEAVDESIGH